MFTIPLLALVGAVLSAVVGTFWYSQSTPMGRLHMQFLGFDKLSLEEQQQKIAEAKPRMPKMYAAQMGLSFLTALSVVFIVIMSMRNGMPFAMALGFVFANWLCFMVPIIGSSILWSNVDRSLAWKKFFSDIGANLVTVLLIGLVASFFA